MPHVDELRALLDVKRVLVPCDGSKASFEAVSLACAQAKRTNGRVYVVHVIEVRRILPLDADLPTEAHHGETILAEAERIGEALGVEVEGELLQAREAGHAIVDEAIERGIDAIIIGTEYTRPFGEFQVGRTTQFVMKHAPCQVWMVRMPARNIEGRP